MEPQASDGPSRRQDSADIDGDGTAGKKNVAWGTAEPAQRPVVAPGATAAAPALRRDSKLSDDGQQVEAGYGHGV
jgi:hypothetical protein